MEKEKIKIVGICGSIRPNSSASCILQTIARMIPSDINFTIYTGLEQIPPFNDSQVVPLPVQQFITLLEQADGVLFCTPEYAFGVPGVLKNALDWTVATTAFSDKPVAVITAASSGEKAHASLLLTLTALGTKRTEEANLLISFVRNKLDEKGEVKDVETLEAIKEVVNAFIKTIEGSKVSEIS